MPKITPEDITAALAEQGITEAKVEEPKVEVEEEPVVAENATVEDEVEAEDEVEEDIEAKAREQGWRPDGPKSAEQFLKDGEYIEEIKARGKEIKSLKKQVDELMKHVSGLKKAGYQEKIDMIQAEREEAVARSDIDSLNYLDEELNKVKNEMTNDIKPQHEVPQAFAEFDERHKDLANDYSLEATEIKQFITDRTVQLMQSGLDPDTTVQVLERDMAFKFPERFKSKEERAKPKAQAVESDSRPVTKSKRTKFTINDLTYEQKQVCYGLERKGVMTKEDYIKQLVEIGELK